MSDSSNVIHLPASDTERRRDHVTLPIDVLARKLSEAEECGYGRAMLDLNTPPLDRWKRRQKFTEQADIRAAWYASLLRRMLGQKP